MSKGPGRPAKYEVLKRDSGFPWGKQFLKYAIKLFDFSYLHLYISHIHDIIPISGISQSKMNETNMFWGENMTSRKEEYYGRDFLRVGYGKVTGGICIS